MVTRLLKWAKQKGGLFAAGKQHIFVEEFLKLFETETKEDLQVPPLCKNLRNTLKG